MLIAHVKIIMHSRRDGGAGATDSFILRRSANEVPRTVMLLIDSSAAIFTDTRTYFVMPVFPVFCHFHESALARSHHWQSLLKSELGGFSRNVWGDHKTALLYANNLSSLSLLRMCTCSHRTFRFRFVLLLLWLRLLWVVFDFGGVAFDRRASDTCMQCIAMQQS